MKKLFLIFVAAVLALSANAYLQPYDKEMIKAMKDELTRNYEGLKMQGLPKPYFITYKVTDGTRYNFAANRGSLTDISSTSYIQTKVGLRVGTYKEDNGFFDSFTLSFASRHEAGRGYDAVRAALWDNTNRAYKESLSLLAKKQAYKKGRNISDDGEDFTSAEPACDLQPLSRPVVDAAYWREIVKAMSARGNLKELDGFSVAVNIVFDPVYFVSSEGAEYTRDAYYIKITILAEAKAKDGFELRENKQAFYASFEDVPSKEELVKKAEDFALQTVRLTRGVKAQPFIGPVLLEKAAAAALFNSVFVKAAINVKAVYSEGRAEPVQGEFAQKTGLKIMPVIFDVTDNPLAVAFNGVKLTGSYRVDDEGVRAQEIEIVNAGKLAGLPASRSLAKGQKASNGHAYGGLKNENLFATQDISNLFFSPRSAIPDAAFKAKFLEYCKSEGLDYCYIVRDSLVGGSFSAYMVDAKTGAETPVYGASVKDLSTRTLRDIEFAADDSAVYNNAESSIIAPSVILSEAEIKPTQNPPSRAPLLPKP
jgi:hypothetical protein